VLNPTVHSVPRASVNPDLCLLYNRVHLRTASVLWKRNLPAGQTTASAALVTGYIMSSPVEAAASSASAGNENAGHFNAESCHGVTTKRRAMRCSSLAQEGRACGACRRAALRRPYGHRQAAQGRFERIVWS